MLAGVDETERFIPLNGRMVSRREGALVLIPGATAPVALEDCDSGLFACLGGARTHAEHLERLRDAFGPGLDVRGAAAALARLRDAGALMPLSRYLAAAAGKAAERGPARPVSAVGVMGSRSCALGSAKSFLAAAAKRDDPFSVVLCDDRGDLPPVQGAVYFGPEERRRLAEEIRAQDAALDPALLDFALFGDAAWDFRAGANRNAFLLLQAGTLAVMSDDDESCAYAPPPGADGGVSYSSRPADMPCFLFLGHQEALDFAGPLREDLVELHEGLLGRTAAEHLSDLLAADQVLDFSDAAEPLTGALLSHGSRVIATSAGVLGDSGMGSPRSLLFLEGENRSRVVEHAESFRAASRSRFMLSAARRKCVYAGPFFRCGHSGYDARRMLPPFPPIGRNEDGVWGLLAARCYAPGALAHIPAAVVHRPPETRRFSGADFLNLDLRANDVLSQFIQLLPQTSLFPLSAESALQIIGRQLCDLSEAPRAVFLDALTEARMRILAREMERCDEFLSRYRASPVDWAEDVDRLKSAYGAAAGLHAPRLMTDAGRGSGEPVSAAQEYLGRFGRLLCMWPALVEAAQRVASGRSGHV